jgi:tRNA threonylcarbamoyl adenosine modification protein YeaZ
MIVLAIDTSSTICAVCVYDAGAGEERGRAVLDLGKGHAEHLMGVVDDALNRARLSFPDMDRIVVSVGPGSFTGIRVGVAAARGFALARRIPAVGVTTLEAIAAAARVEFAGVAIMVALDGGRGDINLAAYDTDGRQILVPRAVGLAEAARLAALHATVLVGSAANAVASAAGPGLKLGPAWAIADIGVYARLGAAKDAGERPKPLYLREADAKPQAGFVLPRIRS